MGRHRSSLARFGCTGLRWPSWVIIDHRRTKACIGLRCWPALACVGHHGPSWVLVDQRRPALAFLQVGLSRCWLPWPSLSLWVLIDQRTPTQALVCLWWPALAILSRRGSSSTRVGLCCPVMGCVGPLVVVGRCRSAVVAMKLVLINVSK
jgi:hypothetical protein